MASNGTSADSEKLHFRTKRISSEATTGILSGIVTFENFTLRMSGLAGLQWPAAVATIVGRLQEGRLAVELRSHGYGQGVWESRWRVLRGEEVSL